MSDKVGEPPRKLEDKQKVLKGNYILTLTSYEVGNALWKEALSARNIDISEANKILETALSTSTLMNVIEL
ncbi:MAG: hypothetical protein ACPLZG_09980, partial [Thermoproteota archaeon]